MFGFSNLYIFKILEHRILYSKIILPYFLSWHFGNPCSPIFGSTFLTPWVIFLEQCSYPTLSTNHEFESS